MDMPYSAYNCEHIYVHGGIKYSILQESGAVFLRLYDWFYCSRCLDVKLKPLDYVVEANEIALAHNAPFNATPLHERV